MLPEWTLESSSGNNQYHYSIQVGSPVVDDFAAIEAYFLPTCEV